jgi:hypothetical protein
VVQPLQDATAAAGTTAGDVAGSRVHDSSPAVPKQHQQQAELPDILPFKAVQQHGSAAGIAAGAGMSQVVQDLFAVQGRTGPGGVSSRRASAASGAAAANAATEEAVGHQPPRTRWVCEGLAADACALLCVWTRPSAGDAVTAHPCRRCFAPLGHKMNICFCMLAFSSRCCFVICFPAAAHVAGCTRGTCICGQ